MQLRIIEGPDKGKVLLLIQGKDYLIGRDIFKCDFVLSDESVSSLHASIWVYKDCRTEITDNGSFKGTFINGFKITSPTQIFPGDNIIIGNNYFIYEITEDYNHNQPNFAQDDYHNNLNRSTVLLRKGTIITIGRDPSNTLVLNHPHVSRVHAEIEISSEGTFIKDLNSTNGTYVDGILITDKQILHKSSVIRISGFSLTMKDFQLIKQDETAGRVEIDVVNLSKVIILPSGEERVLLNNISFKVLPCEFVTILGGSGAGKTTLLKALIGAWPASFGELYINRSNYYEQYGVFKSMIGFVPQDDIVHLDLTVEEALMYAALLRMPDDTSPDERIARVETVINVLELKDRQNAMVKKLSGGERKRVSIGVELITKPSILFLDEPTSGLDPGLEKMMMELLRNMADQGQTIFLVTHATSNIHLCDKVLFLTEGGRMAFYGTPDEALDYFDVNSFAEIFKMVNLDKDPETWQIEYMESNLAIKYGPNSYSDYYNSNKKVGFGINRSSFFLQWYHLTRRYYQTMVRDQKNLILLLLQPVLIAFLIGIMFQSYAPVFETSPYNPEELVVSEIVLREGREQEILEKTKEVQRQRRNMEVIVLSIVISAIYFGASNAAREIVKEIVIYKRERLVNLRIAPYILSKIFVLALLSIVQSFMFLFIINMFLGLPSFLLTILAFYLITLSSILMGLTISAVASNSNVAITVLPIILIPQLLLSGQLIPIEEVSSILMKAIFVFILAKWGFELLGGGIIDINSLIAFQDNTAFEGPFEMHWWILVAFIISFYLVSSLALLNRDKDLS